VTAYGKDNGASLEAMKPVARAALQRLADNAGHDLGINATTNLTHNDIRHNGVSHDHPEKNNPNIAGTAVDIGEIGGTVVRKASSSDIADVKNAALGTGDTKSVYTPDGLYEARGYGYPKNQFQNAGLQKQHEGHFHVSFFIDSEK
jgi:hypothetical protein